MRDQIAAAVQDNRNSVNTGPMTGVMISIPASLLLWAVIVEAVRFFVL